MAGPPLPQAFDARFERSVKKLPGAGRTRLERWADLQRSHQTSGEKARGKITRKMAHGLLERLHLSSGGKVLYTASIERFHAPFRGQLANLARKSLHTAAPVQT
ncbi:MAG TPA: hypothetical protein VFA15_05070 [Nitrososphaera sp.]|nr:hypothetical protein [Nitrososphaera sp.]